MFSKTTEYALRATFYIAQKGTKENKIPIGRVAEAVGSPLPFTAKILQTLTKDNKIISSVRGPHGGFYLSEKAKKLPVMSVLEVMHEGSTLTDCILGLEQCTSIKPCPFHERFSEIREQLVDMFEQKSIGEVANNLESHKIFLTTRTEKK